MKTIFTCILSFAAACVFAQVPNGGFESWTSQGTYDDPTGWITSNNNSSNITHIVQSSNVHSGTLAVRMNTLTIQGITIGGILAAPSVGNFFPINMNTPSGITGWYISNFVNGDKLQVTTAMRQGNTSVGGCTNFILNNTSVYQQFTFPFTYSQSAVPDSAAVAFSEVTVGGNSIYLDPNTYVILDDVDFVASTGISEIIARTGLTKIYPNPGNGTCWIEYSITDQTFVQLAVYDITGDLVQQLVAQEQTSGNYRVAVNAFTLAHGLYTIRLSAGNYSSEEKWCVAE